jgi:LytS/YehU family sensor histidine kinase
MQVAVSSNPGQEFWGPVPAWIPMFGFLSVFLTIELLRVSRTTRALYVWAGEQAASVAEARAAAEHARLTALQAQMSPAFLFNALDTVITLARSDTPRAERVVERLSGVLRRGLKRTAESMSSVDDEVQFIREYLDVEGERLESRLHVTFALDPEAASVFVPTGCLQTLVENAVKFAVSRQPAGGHIRVVTERLDDKVRLAVEDDGPRFSPERLEASGIGSLRERLHGSDGEAAEIYTGTPFTGARVMITLPVSAPAGIGQ